MYKNMEGYQGTLSSAKLRGSAKKAYVLFGCMKRRCTNPIDISYKWYGGKGIKIGFTQREFMHWFIKKHKGHKFNKVSISRKDHSKNYTFDNIFLQELSDNCKEMASRHKKRPHKQTKVLILDKKTGVPIVSCFSVMYASEFSKIPYSTIGNVLNMRNKSRSKYTFIAIDRNRK